MKLKLSEVFFKEILISFSVCFCIDSINFDFKKGGKKDIGMECGIEKCVMLVMEKGKIEVSWYRVARW